MCGCGCSYKQTDTIDFHVAGATVYENPQTQDVFEMLNRIKDDSKKLFIFCSLLCINIYVVEVILVVAILHQASQTHVELLNFKT